MKPKKIRTEILEDLPEKLVTIELLEEPVELNENAFMLVSRMKDTTVVIRSASCDATFNMFADLAEKIILQDNIDDRAEITQLLLSLIIKVAMENGIRPDNLKGHININSEYTRKNELQ